MFSSRQEAGRLLGEKLGELSLVKPVVLGITRGGVVVAAEVARELSAPLYPLVIKKIGHPYNPEFALGAMAPDYRVVTSDITDITDITDEEIEDIRKKIEERKKTLGVDDKKIRKAVKNRTAIIVDDGIATGLTFEAAVQYVKGLDPKQVAAAAPVADKKIVQKLEKLVNRIIILEIVDDLGAVGNFYQDFSPVEDSEVLALLKSAS